jgi:4-hydroxybenzoate polyprenyltransferase
MLRTLGKLGYLGRIGMSSLTMSVPVLGALTTKQPLLSGDLFLLMLIGLCAHLFGFALNDLLDHPIDRMSPLRQRHPLIRGDLAWRDAWIFTLAQVPLALAVYWFGLRGSLNGLLLLYVSIFLSVIYNLWSKKGQIFSLLAEISLATSIGVLCLVGAVYRSSDVQLQTAAFSFALTLILLLLNSVPSGLKDLKADRASGALSFVIVAGSRVKENGELVIPHALRIYSLILQVLIILCVVALVRLFDLLWVLAVLSIVLVVYGGLHLRLMLWSPTYTYILNGKPLLNGHYNYFALSLTVLPLMPTWLQIVYGVAVFAVLLVPLQLGFKLYRSSF